MDLNLIAFLPLARDGVVTVFSHTGGYSRSVDRDGIAEALAVGILIKVRGNDLIPYPTRDTDLHGKLPSSILVYGNGNVTVPWVLCCLA